jgi:RNA polymerase subunit RPABC4/transcription elongation factor Spt4
MKTKACPACENGVSTKAYTCPHCGHPLRVTLLNFVLVCAIILFVISLMP